MDVAPERTWTYSQRVLKKGTRATSAPRKLMVCWSTGYLDSNRPMSTSTCDAKYLGVHIHVREPRD